MTNREMLKHLIIEVFLIGDDEFSFSLTRQQIPTWDSLGVVSLAVGVQETFGYHLSPEQAVGLNSIADLVAVLSKNGVNFDG
jgi:acyl carrier protein